MELRGCWGEGGGKGEREREREREREMYIEEVANTQENIRIPKRKNHKLKGILKPWEPGTVTSTIPLEVSHNILNT